MQNILKINSSKANIMDQTTVSNYNTVQNKKQTKIKNKKRIGNYSYRLNETIGKGFTSSVYKAIKNNNKNQTYAIKVVKLNNINKKLYQLIQTQISIMQKMSHPNILQFYQVIYTKNNCYIITQFCEGGTLHEHTKQHQDLDWANIIRQVSAGCQYLAQKLIIHRDIKPANIFLKNGVWKIGDFGFSCIVQSTSDIIQGNSAIGSPLYMPPESLSNHIYSLKTDSFALGILIYYLLVRQYPWYGKNRKSLLQEYRKKLDQSKLKNYSEPIRKKIRELCNLQMQDRMLVSQCDFSCFIKKKNAQQIRETVLSLSSYIPQQVTLCQFINYLVKNCSKVLPDGDFFIAKVNSHLTNLTSLFQWEKYKSLSDLKDTHLLTENYVEMSVQDYQQILNAGHHTIKHLLCTPNNHTYAGKVMQYIHALHVIINKDLCALIQVIHSLQLHKDFSFLVLNEDRMRQLDLLLKQYE